MIKRLVVFQVILLGGLSLVFALPKTPPIKDAALRPVLRDVLIGTAYVGGPMGKPSKEETDILAKDTEFVRRNYYREIPVEDQEAMGRFDPRLIDVLNASIVLSGKDLSSSIHALERCLTAQGFNIPEASTMRIKLSNGQTLPVRRLVCEKFEPNTNRLSRSIAYYWFVGHDSVTSNHIRRGIKDFWDRIVHGYDQRWAYVTVTAYLHAGPIMEMGKDDKEPRPLTDRAGNPRFHRPLTPAQADGLVEEFIADLGPEIMRTEQIKEWRD
jgi:Protein of unknown function (DUF3485)